VLYFTQFGGIFEMTNQVKTTAIIVLLIAIIAFFMFLIIANTTLSYDVPLGETIVIVVVPILAFTGIVLYKGWKLMHSEEQKRHNRES